MRVAVGLLCVAAVAVAYDAVLFSSTVTITKDSPSLENLVATADASAPVVFLVTRDFKLAQFSKAAAVYSKTHESTSSIANAAKAATSAASRFVAEAVHVPDASYVTPSAGYIPGAPLYVVLADDWASLDELAKSVLPALAKTARAFVLTDDDVVSQQEVKRVKRVTVLEDGAAAPPSNDAVPNIPFPLVLPPINVTEVTGVPALPCLFYLEGLTIYARQDEAWQSYFGIRELPGAKDANGVDLKNENTWEYDPSYVECPEFEEAWWKTTPVKKHKFIISVKPSGAVITDKIGKSALINSVVKLQLDFESTRTGYWGLKNVTLLEELSVKLSDGTTVMTAPKGAIAKNPAMVGIDSVWGWSLSCWDTQAAFFDATGTPNQAADKAYQIGVSFHGLQVHVYGKNGVVKDAWTNMTYFTRNVESCTGTFSAASWMGITTSLVLISVFLFGFLMLNSVQTGDRFDDPKQKQIIINVRE